MSKVTIIIDKIEYINNTEELIIKQCAEFGYKNINIYQETTDYINDMVNKIENNANIKGTSDKPKIDVPLSTPHQTIKNPIYYAAKILLAKKWDPMIFIKHIFSMLYNNYNMVIIPIKYDEIKKEFSKSKITYAPQMIIDENNVAIYIPLCLKQKILLKTN